MLVSNSVFALGKVGQAFSFNGSDNLVAVPDSDEWTLGVNDFTLDMWVNFNDIKSRTAFIGPLLSGITGHQSTQFPWASGCFSSRRPGI